MTNGRVDRRSTGVQRVHVSNGNGDSQEGYSVNVTKAKAWLTFLWTAITIIATVLGGVWAGVKFGVSSEVGAEVERESKPGGHIDQAVERRSREQIEEIQAVFQDDLDTFDAELKTFDKKIDANKEIGIRLEERQIAMDGKIDDKHEELLRAIREHADHPE